MTDITSESLGLLMANVTSDARARSEVRPQIRTYVVEM
jgi:hypothetical protein